MNSDTSKQSVRKFKGATVIDWDSEPADERPSEFAPASSFGAPAARRAPVKRPRQRGFGALWASLAVLATVAVGGMLALSHFLQR